MARCSQAIECRTPTVIPAKGKLKSGATNALKFARDQKLSHGKAQVFLDIFGYITYIIFQFRLSNFITWQWLIFFYAHLRLKMTLSVVLYTATIIGVIILYSIESQRMPQLDGGLAWSSDYLKRHFHSWCS